MIEYIAKGKNSELPKNVRQIGDVSIERKVYIEDYALSFVKELSIKDEEGRVGILFGKESTKDEEEITFIKGAMLVDNASVYEGNIAFTEETWNQVRANKNLYFAQMDIVGWFLLSDSIRLENNVSAERTHIDSFGRNMLVLYVNPAENTEDIYTFTETGLEALEGYFVYFEKNEEMQTYMVQVKEQIKKQEADEAVIRRYRQLVKDKNNEPKSKQQLSLMYVLSAILVIFVLITGVGRLQVQKGEEESTRPVTGNEIEQTAAVSATAASVEDETLNVDYAQGNVTTTPAESSQADSTETITQEEPSSEETQATTEVTTEETTEAATEETTTEATTEEERYEEYVIQQGDTIYDILLRHYGSIDRLHEFFDLNGITDGGNSIEVGDKVLLPK